MRPYFLTLPILLINLPLWMVAQNQGRPDVIQKTNNAVNKISNIIAVFQPYLLKARQLYYDAKQLSSDVKGSAKATFGKDNSGNNGAGNNYDTSHSTYQNNYQNN